MALQKELDNASDYILQLENRFNQSQQTSLELLKQLKLAEVDSNDWQHKVEESQKEIYSLKQYISDFNARVTVYIPAQNDPIDKKMADFINNYPDRKKLKIIFSRESQGVY